jgi:hypothetical protein
MQTESIAKKLQKDFIGSFWSMLRELEEAAENNLDKHFVEGYYRQWNAVTGDDKKPRWMK